jgi:hypothetical protein
MLYMTIKTVLPKGWVGLQSADSKGLVTTISKGRSRNPADFDPGSLLNKKDKKSESMYPTLAPDSNEQARFIINLFN